MFHAERGALLPRSRDWASEQPPAMVRWVALLFLVVSAISDATSAPSGPVLVGRMLGHLVLLVTVFRPGVGSSLFLGLLGLSLFHASRELWPGIARALILPGMLVLGMVSLTHPLFRTAIFFFALLAWLGAQSWLGGVLVPDALFNLVPLFVLIMAVGVAARRLLYQRRTDDERIRTLKAQVENARAHERHAIAGELHDLVAHDLTLLVMMARTGALAESGGRGSVRATFDRMEQVSAAALADLRRLFGVLQASSATRTESGDDATVAGGSLPEELRTAVLELKEVGFDVVTEEMGDTTRVPASLRLPLRRSLRESVTNVAKYAARGSKVELSCVVGESEVTLSIRSQRSEAPADRGSTGTGLIRMQERADTLGGTCAVVADGRTWWVQLALPLEPPPARRGPRPAAAAVTSPGPKTRRLRDVLGLSRGRRASAGRTSGSADARPADA